MTEEAETGHLPGQLPRQQLDWKRKDHTAEWTQRQSKEPGLSLRWFSATNQPPEMVPMAQFSNLMSAEVACVAACHFVNRRVQKSLVVQSCFGRGVSRELRGVSKRLQAKSERQEDATSARDQGRAGSALKRAQLCASRASHAS